MLIVVPLRSNMELNRAAFVEMNSREDAVAAIGLTGRLLKGFPIAIKLAVPEAQSKNTMCKENRADANLLAATDRPLPPSPRGPYDMKSAGMC